MRKHVMTIAAAAAGCLAAGANAQSWDETIDGGGDAGSLVPQTITGVGPVTGITGVTGTGDEQDLYMINIVDVDAFSAITGEVSPGVDSHDTQLFLFDMSGMLIVGNDDNAASASLFGSGLFGGATDDGYPGLTTPGTYVLAVSGWGGGSIGDPMDASGNPLADQAAFDEMTGPDGLGGGNPLAGWAAGAETGTYNIILTGVEAVPAPGALALLGLAGVIGVRRRRHA